MSYGFIFFFFKQKVTLTNFSDSNGLTRLRGHPLALDELISEIEYVNLDMDKNFLLMLLQQFEAQHVERLVG